MKIKVMNYPRTFSFDTKEKLPPFKYGCSVRTAIVQKQLAKITYNVLHVPKDFIVERVRKTATGETWHLGS